MKKIYFIALFFVFLTEISHANDTVINSYGGTIFPTRETRIELKKELLTMSPAGFLMEVRVRFEFYNPDGERDELVGFVTPPHFPPGEDVDATTIHHPNIRDFQAVVNGTVTPHFVKPVLITEFRSQLDAKWKDSYIYYFHVQFKAGINTIAHSYTYEPILTSGGVYGEQIYRYRLTSGKSWAHSRIGDFTLEIRMGTNASFTVPRYLEKGSRERFWKLHGTGKISEHDGTKESKSGLLYVYVRDGYIQYSKENFVPDRDLEIKIYSPIDHVDPLRKVYWNQQRLHTFSKKELRIARNTLFAMHGYAFQSQDLSEHFSHYFWYDPDPKVPNKLSILTKIEQNLLHAILGEEQKRELQ